VQKSLKGDKWNFVNIGPSNSSLIKVVILRKVSPGIDNVFGGTSLLPEGTRMFDRNLLECL
jgi:hypothetical protein